MGQSNLRGISGVDICNLTFFSGITKSARRNSPLEIWNQLSWSSSRLEENLLCYWQ